jgi:hypothetical protein
LKAIPNDSVVLLEGGKVARVDQITFGKGTIRVVDSSHEEHWLPRDAELVLIATPEEAIEGFIAMKQLEYGLPPKPKYDVVMPWYEAHTLRQMVAESPEAVLALFEQRYPSDSSGDRDRPRKFGWVARLGSLQGDMLTVGSWQQIILSNGRYSLADDEGPHTVQLTPLERTF